MATTVWKGYLTFGLVSVPVRLHRAARKETVRLHYLARSSRAPNDFPPVPSPDRENAPAPATSRLRVVEAPDDQSADEAPQPEAASRIRQQIVDDEQRPVETHELLRGHEVAPGEYATFTASEIRALRPPTSTAIEILRSVKLAEIDPVYFEASYYIVPDSAGDKAYSLLFTALRNTGYVALGTIAMHGREHVLVIRPGRTGLLAHTMFYEDEVRASGESQPNADAVSPKELELAEKFIELIAGPFDAAEFKDTHRAKLEALIAGKAERGEVLRTPASPESPVRVPVVDIMEALRKSIEERQPKPPRREVERATPAKRKPGRKSA